MHGFGRFLRSFFEPKLTLWARYYVYTLVLHVSAQPCRSKFNEHVDASRLPSCLPSFLAPWKSRLGVVLERSLAKKDVAFFSNNSRHAQPAGCGWKIASSQLPSTPFNLKAPTGLSPPREKESNNTEYRNEKSLFSSQRRVCPECVLTPHLHPQPSRLKSREVKREGAGPEFQSKPKKGAIHSPARQHYW